MIVTEPRPFTLTVDPALLDHTEHLPETIDCYCGYHRVLTLAV